MMRLGLPQFGYWLREVSAVEVLRRVWVQTFRWMNDEADPSVSGKPPALRWRTEAEGFPPSTLMRRRSRYIGSAKPHLQQLLAAATINLGRIADWIAEKPLAPIRQSAFAHLMTAAA